MKKLMILATILGILAMASMSFAQNIGLTFDEAGTTTVLDGRTDTVPNPDFFGFPSVNVWVVAYDLNELFGYEYNLSTDDATGLVSAPVVYPTATASDFGNSSIGDVRAGTGVCFLAGSGDAGPDPAHIRLAKHTFTWQNLPTVDVLYCIGPSIDSGAATPQYTECNSQATKAPFGVANISQDSCTPDGCAVVVFEWDDATTPTNCQRDVVGSQEKSWGSLKSSF